MTSSSTTKTFPSSLFQGEAPVIQLLSHLILKAQESRASDLHLEPLSNAVRVRIRVDGALHEVQSLSKKLQESLVSRLKIMSASMDIAEKRLPQEGRFQFQCGIHIFDIRISTIPTIYGESVVLRFLERSSLPLGLSELGLEPEDHCILKNLIAQPYGLLLVTGPTGSGKTTTLYSCLQELNHPNQKIITVEDPIEYQLPGVNQVQVEKEIGRTFSSVLRAMLRQASNKIMIGEIRDAETARIAINASLTGHLIFSSLHTNDAPSALMRLQNLGIPPYLIAGGLRAIIAQRLVRRLCSHCKAPTDFTKYEETILGLKERSLSMCHPMKASGCSECQETGFQGRLGIFEILTISDLLRQDIHEKKTSVHLREHMRHHGIKTLREDGLKKVFSGLTTLHEILTNTLQ
ncbi:MAG: type II/IV secretion system protein [Verrucomicrobia bacterium]|nr:MAG: type II/IV secretion system protein [Verrucomicrobiota bacterium]